MVLRSMPECSSVKGNVRDRFMVEVERCGRVCFACVLCTYFTHVFVWCCTSFVVLVC